MSKFQIYDEWENFGEFNDLTEAQARARQIAEDYKHSATKHDIKNRRKEHSGVYIENDDGEIIDGYDYF